MSPPLARVRVVDLKTAGNGPGDACEIGWQHVVQDAEGRWNLSQNRGARFVNPGRPISPETMAGQRPRPHRCEAGVGGALRDGYRASMSEDDRPAFFVARIAEDKQEEAYARMASAVRSAVPPLDERIYSITFQSRGEIWTATVGEQLHGSASRTVRSRGRKVERESKLSNESTVIAIFAGSPYHVWHDGASSVWVNPFLAGEPISVRRFKA